MRPLFFVLLLLSGCAYLRTVELDHYNQEQAEKAEQYNSQNIWPTNK